MKSPSRTTGLRNRLIGIGAVVVLVVAMLLCTRFETPESLADIGPQQFNATSTATELFDRARADLPAAAKPLAEVLPAAQSSIKGAAEQFQAVSPGENSYDFAVTVTGTVTPESTADSLRLQVEGLTDTPVIVPLTTAVNGTVIRDQMGFRFGDAPGQTAYQQVGDEIKKLVQAQVVTPLGDATTLVGKTVTVVGSLNVTSTGGNDTVPAAKPANVQPVSIEVAA
jgi:predicted lipoprotein